MAGVGYPARGGVPSPAAPRSGRMMSPRAVSTSSWISWKPNLAVKHSLEAVMWRRTAARLRNRPLVLRLGSESAQAVALSDLTSAKHGQGTAEPRFRELSGCSCELE